MKGEESVLEYFPSSVKQQLVSKPHTKSAKTHSIMTPCFPERVICTLFSSTEVTSVYCCLLLLCAVVVLINITCGQTEKLISNANMFFVAVLLEPP